MDLLQINHLPVGFILGPVERQEGRKGDAQIHISGKHKCAILSYVGLEACLFQAPHQLMLPLSFGFYLSVHTTSAALKGTDFKLLDCSHTPNRFPSTTAAMADQQPTTPLPPPQPPSRWTGTQVRVSFGSSCMLDVHLGRADDF